MNEKIIDIIVNFVQEIKFKLNFVNKFQLCEELCYSPEELDSLIDKPIYNASIYLEILEYIDKYIGRR